MNVKELIQKLEEIENKEMIVVMKESHEYWGTVYNELYEVSVQICQADGPKKGLSKAVVIG
jgi:hypothetical protein